jgi:hypothetical protein
MTMLDTYLEHLDNWLAYGRARFYGVTLGGGVLLFILAGWLWWHYAYLNPQNVFWAAVNNNLIVNGVTKHTVSQDNTGNLNQYDQIGLGAHNIVRSVATITQSPSDTTKSTVVTETLGTPEANFARYTKIDTNQKSVAGQNLDFSKVVNQWSRQELGAGSNGAFADAIFDAIPLAHLNAQQRNQVVGDLKRNNTYNVDFARVEKKRNQGRLYYFYTALLAPDKYVVLLKQVDGLMGLNQLKNLDPSQYQNGPNIDLTIGVDAYGHQLQSVTYTGSNRHELYAAWGVSPSPILPNSTVSQAELQTKLNGILNGQ